MIIIKIGIGRDPTTTPIIIVINGKNTKEIMTGINGAIRRIIIHLGKIIGAIGMNRDRKQGITSAGTAIIGDIET